jgi:mono/diheme cytochrome c family protein
MKKSRIAFAVSSVLLLVVLAISPLKDMLREWKGYQHDYNRLIEGLPQRVAPAEIGIRQIWLPKLDRVDRCVTCHLGIKEKALAGAKQPFRLHPRIDHDIDEFGCTVCHEGQGPATTYTESVGKVAFWDKPMLPREYMEASCGKCHKESVVPHAPVLTAGRKLLEESNCVGCHKIAGYRRQWVPTLNGIGAKVNRAWLYAWLKDPKAYFPKTRMANFHLSDSEADNLADFLMSFTAFSDSATMEPLPQELAQPSAAAAAALQELGATRVSEARCISCHSINGKGGYVATDLGKVASKVSEVWLYNYIKNPKRFQPGVVMPRFRFTDKDLAGVVAYMKSEYADFDLAEPPKHTPDPQFYEKGLALFKKYNCRGCHVLDGVGSAGDVGPDLTLIGSKKLYEIDFGQSGIDESLPSYLYTKVTKPRVFSAASKMPDFGFSPEEGRAIAVALLGNTSEQIPEEMQVRPAAASTYDPQGEFGKLVNDLACFGCHTMYGRGRLVATDLTLEASAAKRDWIEGYFKVPYSLRPILTERMPNFRLSDSEIKVLAEYMTRVFVADSLAHDVTLSAQAAEKGKALYEERFGCQGCHQIGGKGGYVGPPLDKVADRLQPGWIFHWLKNPQALRPASIEPNNRLTDQDAEALTAYLLTLK